MPDIFAQREEHKTGGEVNETFALGQTVKLSKFGLTAFRGLRFKGHPYDENIRGNVTGILKSNRLRIRRDGTKHSETFHRSFWTAA